MRIADIIYMFYSSFSALSVIIPVGFRPKTKQGLDLSFKRRGKRAGSRKEFG
jgi:hypothetical protein